MKDICANNGVDGGNVEQYLQKRLEYEEKFKDSLNYFKTLSNFIHLYTDEMAEFVEKKLKEEIHNEMLSRDAALVSLWESKEIQRTIAGVTKELNSVRSKGDAEVYIDKCEGCLRLIRAIEKYS